MSEFNYKNIDILSLSLDGFEGPIDLLLVLARSQKVDLSEISISDLADQYIKFINQYRNINIEIADFSTEIFHGLYCRNPLRGSSRLHLARQAAIPTALFAFAKPVPRSHD